MDYAPGHGRRKGIVVQLQRPFPSPATLEPTAVVRKLATEEMLMTRPGSNEVASFSRRGVSLVNARWMRQGGWVQGRLAHAAVTGWEKVCERVLRRKQG